MSAFGQRLDRIRLHHQHAATRQRAERARERRRNGERKRAGAGNHQHRDRGGECARRIDESPGGGRQRRQCQHARDEAARGEFAGHLQPRALRHARGPRARRFPRARCPRRRARRARAPVRLPARCRRSADRRGASITGADSPLSSASSTRQRSVSSTPSAGTMPPSATRTQSPTRSSWIPTRCRVPSSHCRSANGGVSRASASVRSRARCRARISR